LPNGKVFDSSVDRGQPFETPLNRVIPGWTEVMQLMPVGSKYRVWLHPDLAYGNRGAGPDIPANQMLIFDIELLDILSE
jgi:FKBP-type peptidyl-prolyl cis-trans isomerase